MRKEAPGILYRWMLAAREFLDIGLNPPECVKAASKEMFADADVVGRFLNECLSFTPSGFTPSEELQIAYSTFVHEVGHPDTFVEMMPLYRRLKAFPGVVLGRHRSNGQQLRGWLGINVKQTETDETLRQDSH